MNFSLALTSFFPTLDPTKLREGQSAELGPLLFDQMKPRTA